MTFIESSHIIIIKKLVSDELETVERAHLDSRDASREKYICELETMLDSIRVHEEFQKKKKSLNMHSRECSPGLSNDPVDW